MDKEKDLVILYKEVDSKLLAKTSSSFLFEWNKLISYKKNKKDSVKLDLNEKQFYNCICKYLNRTYAFVLTDSKNIIFSWDNYKDRIKVLEDIKNWMKLLGFKPIDDETDEDKELLEKEIDLFFSKREEKEFKPVVKFNNKDKLSVKILCWLPWSWKTTYYSNNFKKPFSNFIRNLSDSFNSYNVDKNDLNFSELYKRGYKEKELDFLIKENNLRNFIYINLDYASIEYTNPSLYSIFESRYSKENTEINKCLKSCLESKDKIKYLKIILDLLAPKLKEATDIIVDWLFIKKLEYNKIVKILSELKEVTSVDFLMFENNKELCLNNNRIRLKLQESYGYEDEEKRADCENLINSLEYELLTDKDKGDLRNILSKPLIFHELPIEKATWSIFKEDFAEIPDWIKWRIVSSFKQWIPFIDYENKLIKSDSWQSAGSHWGYDGTKYDDSEEQKSSNFNNLRKLLKDINSKTGNHIKDSDIHYFVDSIIEKNEPKQLDVFDPYTSCKSMVWVVSYKEIIDFFESYDINLEDSWIDWSDFSISSYDQETWADIK